MEKENFEYLNKDEIKALLMAKKSIKELELLRSTFEGDIEKSFTHHIKQSGINVATDSEPTNAEHTIALSTSFFKESFVSGNKQIIVVDFSDANAIKDNKHAPLMQLTLGITGGFSPEFDFKFGGNMSADENVFFSAITAAEALKAAAKLGEYVSEKKDGISKSLDMYFQNDDLIVEYEQQIYELKLDNNKRKGAALKEKIADCIVSPTKEVVKSMLEQNRDIINLVQVFFDDYSGKLGFYPVEISKSRNFMGMKEYKVSAPRQTSPLLVKEKDLSQTLIDLGVDIFKIDDWHVELLSDMPMKNVTISKHANHVDYDDVPEVIEGMKSMFGRENYAAVTVTKPPKPNK